MPAEIYLEWRAFDAIEPLNPAGAILQGFTHSAKNTQTKKKPGDWRQVENNLLQHAAIMKGKK